MRLPKHGKKNGWRRWISRAGKRKAWVYRRINELTMESLARNQGARLVNNFFAEDPYLATVRMLRDNPGTSIAERMEYA